MKKLIFFIVISISSIGLLFGQNEEVLGKWKGEWSNHEGFYFTFILDLAESDAGDITGEFIWKLIKSPRKDEQPKLGLTAKEYITAKYDKDKRKLQIKGFKKEDPHLIIAIDNYDLSLTENGQILEGKTENHGTWKGVFYGQRFEEKENKLQNESQLHGREIITKEELTVSNKEVIMQFWDDQKEDGDIISLNLNGEWILRNYIVKKTKGEILLDLVQGENYLILHAENLGAVPPNTAAIAIKENGKEIKSIQLNSDMGKSEAIKIIKD